MKSYIFKEHLHYVHVTTSGMHLKRIDFGKNNGICYGNLPAAYTFCVDSVRTCAENAATIHAVTKDCRYAPQCPPKYLFA